MVLAKELVDKLKKIEDFDITYESSDKDSGEIYIDYNNIVFVLEHYIYKDKFCLSGGLLNITMLTNLPVMHGVKILAVSHTLIPMLLEDKVYAFKYRIMLSPSTYVALETGYSIKINDYNEREEV